METTLKLAIETYAELKGLSVENVAQALLDGDEVMLKHVIQLMVSVA